MQRINLNTYANHPSLLSSTWIRMDFVCVLTTCLLTPRENKKRGIHFLWFLRSQIPHVHFWGHWDLPRGTGSHMRITMGSHATRSFRDTQNLIECNRLLQGGCQQVANKVTRICILAWSKKNMLESHETWLCLCLVLQCVSCLSLAIHSIHSWAFIPQSCLVCSIFMLQT